MGKRILITGSSGLVGRTLIRAFEARGIRVRRLDLKEADGSQGDVRTLDCVKQAMTDCDGVVHLAAISRVVWAEKDPALCHATNIGGLRNVLQVASLNPMRPWVMFASSREVYGQASCLPATEDAVLQPVNVYGRSKLEGERLVEAARRGGLRASTIRLSNVYGSTADHADRVVPAFARGALSGEVLRVDGGDHTFDFTHVDDVARGILSLAERLLLGKPAPPPIHFTTGMGTTLQGLAKTAVTIAGSSSTIRHAAPRQFDVSRFIGNPERAKTVLGWTPQVSLSEGLSRLVDSFRVELAASRRERTAP